MPAFSFEKISPPPTNLGPVNRGPVPAIEKKQRGVIVQILGRFVEARVERAERVEESIIARREQRPAKD
jgi:hypothetical protein